MTVFMSIVLPEIGFPLVPNAFENFTKLLRAHVLIREYEEFEKDLSIGLDCLSDLYCGVLSSHIAPYLTTHLGHAPLQLYAELADPGLKHSPGSGSCHSERSVEQFEESRMLPTLDSSSLRSSE